METDLLRRSSVSDQFNQARSEPFGMSGFVAVFGNVTEPGAREVRVVDFGKRGNVGQRTAHHGAHDGPGSGKTVASEMVQQIGRADVVRPSSHLTHVVVEAEVETSPTEFQVQTNDDGWPSHSHFPSICGDFGRVNVRARRGRLPNLTFFYGIPSRGRDAFSHSCEPVVQMFE